MKTTGNLGLKKPEGTDIVDINDLNDNADILDGKFGASSGHGHSGTAGDGPKITAAGLAAGAATDAVIGNRTIADTTAPTADTAAPTTLLSGLGNMIKQITGGATWRTAPSMTIAAIKAILDGAVSAATANAIIKRDASGRAQVAVPSAAADIARKDTVDAVQTNLTTHAADTTTHLTAAERTAWNAKAPLASPALTGTPTSPTALPGTRNTQIATTLFVDAIRESLAADIGLKAPIVSPDFLGNPTAFTPAAGTNNTQLATTAFVNTANATKANLATTPQQTTADITYYVRTDGSDSNTGLANTAAGAFKTIGRAISMIPKMVNHKATINVAAGTYAEAVIIAGFVTADALSVIGSGVVSVASVEVNNCQGIIIVTGLTATTTTKDAFSASASRRVVFTSCIATVSSAFPAFWAGSSDMFVNSCTMSNHGQGIAALAESVVYAANNTGVNNGSAYLSVFASSLGYAGSVPGGPMSVGDSGTIVPAGGVLNPWGDNTGAQRTSVVSFRTVNATVPSNVATKVLFQGLSADNLGEFSNSRFTAKNSGMYAIDINLGFNGIPDQGYVDVLLHLNGVEVTASRTGVSGTSTGINAQLHDIFYLTAGQYLEVYMFGSSAFTAEGYATRNTFKIQRLS